ncbi:MFS transporter [Aeromicrobium massiliense]|uniref:MFS transporter n=1 Tax=Aeromicrobium massiliense TaxID=1464554 RepID=UPI0005785C4E|nr:MFS transporter [Aeromicrobium massiliense]
MPATVSRASYALLALAAAAVCFAAADTYVVVLALPDMMSASGLGVDELQRAAPIVSGFLLGYVGVLPLVGRISDLRGRLPVLVGTLFVFALGSVVTAAAYDLESIVAGRFLQGVGGGGLVPPTLALVADLWPAERRGLPLGVVGAVQELGSVLGPLLGAVVLAVADWRAIFWLNTAVGLLLAAGLLQLGARTRASAPSRTDARRPWPDVLGAGLLLGGVVALVLVMTRPQRLLEGVTVGRAFLPVAGDSRWLTPLALALYALVVLLLLRTATSRRPLVQWRGWGDVLRRTDVPGAVLLCGGLGAVIVSFASAEPESAAISDAAWWLLPLAVVCFAGFAVRQRRAAFPLVPPGTLADRAAWGAVLVSFFVGAALIAALVDIPFFARLTIYRDDQVAAAFVLVRFLVALPIGAVLGGWLLRRVAPAPLTAVALLLTAGSFAHMATWDRAALESPYETLSLVVAGLGFGLALAPVNAALLAHTPDDVHGVASGLLVVSRMVGMLVGISVLTTIGLRAFHDAAADIPPAEQLCGGRAAACKAYREAVVDAGISQLHAVFVGAAVCALVAAVLALWVLPRRRA